MAVPEGELEDRIRRLEAVVAALLVADRDLHPFELLDLIRPYSEPDAFYYFLKRMTSRPRERSDSVRQLREVVERTAAESRNAAEGLSAEVQSLRERHDRLQVDTHAIFALQSIGADIQAAKLPRFVPVRVYLGSENPQGTDEVVRAIERLLGEHGFGVADDFPPERGSFFKRWFMRSKEVLTSDEVQEQAKQIAQELKQALQSKTTEKYQSKINKNHAEGIAAVLQAISNEDNAAMQFGTTLLVKTTDENGTTSVGVITLTAAEALALENNRELVKSPRTLLDSLKRACTAK